MSEDYVVTTTAASAQGAKFAISNVNVYDIASTAATVRWISNKPATSLVDYGEDKSGVIDTEADKTLVYEHKVRLDRLRPDTRYNISIKSVTDFDEVEQQTLAPLNTPPASPVCCKINCRISDFAFKTLQGGDFTNRDILGKKVFMVFTKTSCPTCMQQALFLNDVYTNWPKGTDMVMFMVASSEKKADVEEWMKKYGLSVPVYIDPTANLVSGCQFRTIPTALLLDTGSVIRDYKSGGFGNKKDMEATVKRFYETER
jgi:peroxiredoxin